MAAIDFPNNPTLNQVFTSGNKSWQWDGVKWIATGVGGGGAVVEETISPILLPGC